ncbi:hypothetical protein EYF80_046229 [Liparis tanakae]|uniref:Uncharacterized protein n=1 Tax=Liparis tanakae TaxID=230148 RepID=A0A4Z2FQP4_9TELE|nr:hypothetical protein EYF80_046229 [Liparis tanakae]
MQQRGEEAGVAQSLREGGGGGALLAFGMIRLDSLLQMRAADTPAPLHTFSSAAHSYAHFTGSSRVLSGPLGPSRVLSGPLGSSWALSGPPRTP